MEPPLAPCPLPNIHVSTVAPGAVTAPPDTFRQVPAGHSPLTADEIRQRMVLMTVQHQPLFNDYLKKYPSDVCELTFANLLNWNSTYPHYLDKASPHCFCETDGHLLIGFYDTEDRLKLYQPIGPAPETLISSLSTNRAPLEWTCVEEKIARKVEGLGMTVTSDRDNSDYVYLLDELKTLKGKKYHRKRTYINHCMEFNPVVIPLTTDMTASCLEVNRKWLACKECPHDTDATALEVALMHFKTLGLTGVGVLINGTLESFTIGEPLNETMYVSHFLKANYEFPGLFQFTAHAFANSIPATYTYLNKEQDLGIEGLRTCKEGWCPCSMIRKFTIHNDAWHASESDTHVTPAKQGPTGV